MHRLPGLNTLRLEHTIRIGVLRVPEVVDSPACLQSRCEEQGERIVGIDAENVATHVDGRITSVPARGQNHHEV